MGNRIPGDIVLHPVALTAVAVPLINDHSLKAIAPSVATGKISDIAGLVIFPLLVLALIEVCRRNMASPWILTAAIAATALGFAIVKLSPAAADTYSHALGLLAWPARGAAAVARRDALPSVTPIVVIADPTDLLALPSLLIAHAVGSRRQRQTRIAGFPA